MLQGISLVKTPLVVSILSVSRQTSMRMTSSVPCSSERIPPCTAAPGDSLIRVNTLGRFFAKVVFKHLLNLGNTSMCGTTANSKNDLIKKVVRGSRKNITGTNLIDVFLLHIGIFENGLHGLVEQIHVQFFKLWHK